MCGIAGCVVAPGTPVDRQTLERMAAELSHRGPDGSGVDVRGSVGLVHTRLAVVDPTPAARQPMADARNGWLLTYNGEIFNHAELRRRLPDRFHGPGDTATLVEALAAWGEDAIPRCNGLFAFAALDDARERLLLVRDRFGVKPLYIARTGDALWFASEIRALLAAGLPRRPRVDVLAQAVATGWANGRLTPVEGVERVLPGTLVEVSTRTLEARERRWYDPLEAVDRESLRRRAKGGRDESVRATEGALRDSVRRRLMADVPLATMCSGGLDSSLITALAVQEGAAPSAFNVSVADQPEADEGPWAERVAHALGIELHTVRLDAASWRRDLVEVVRHTDYPLNHASAVPMAQLAKLAHSAGVKVLLSGEGADELFGGYPWRHRADHDRFARRRRLPRLPDRRGAGWHSTAVGAYEAEVAERARRAYRAHRGARRRLEGRLAQDIGLYLPHLLNRQDKSTMLASVETRLPFLDPGVVELALTLPLAHRLGPRPKGVLADVARRHLPAEVVERPKIGFAFEYAGYLDGAVRPGFLSSGRLAELIPPGSPPWRESIRRFGPFSLPLWTAEVWCRSLLDGESTEAVERALWLAPVPA